MKAFEAKDVEGMVSFYAEEASVFPPNAPIVSGREAIREMWEELTANPGFELTWESVKVETPFGCIRVKIGRFDGEIVTVSPEFDDSKRAAEAHGVSVQSVIDAAKIAWVNGAS